ETRAYRLARRRALRLATPRSGDHDQAAQSAGSQERPGGLGADRGAQDTFYAAIARVLALELAMGLLLGLGLLQRDHLRLGQHQALLGALGFQRFEPLGHGLQIAA